VIDIPPIIFLIST